MCSLFLNKEIIMNNKRRFDDAFDSSLLVTMWILVSIAVGYIVYLLIRNEPIVLLAILGIIAVWGLSFLYYWKRG
jgi:hypothetical protein